ncbi:uncharacterized protein ATC70_002871 [Mucor velutinosus]|uniref:Tc1-like transposase DDE domain-containing protein n=1 Tax=Mucor velutinosus TaxID=708070 RepID=A0AAN7DI06_9FUNG|nr:hypothetical protein ATC70_002871 [Mucor velutinosus]
MPARLTQDLRNTLQSLLQRGLSFSKIRYLYPGVGNSTLTRLRKLYCPDPARPLGGSPKKLGAKTMSLMSRELRPGTLDSPGAAQESLRLMGQDMSIGGIRKSLKRNGLTSRIKAKINFVSKVNKRLRLAWAKKHRHLTTADWRRWVSSDETRINLWGSDVKSQLQRNDGGVMFWSCITAEGPGYGTTIIEDAINSGLFVDISKTSLNDTLEHFGKTPSDVRIQQDIATPHTSGITKQWFTDNGFNLDKIMDWPPQSPNLNPIEHVWHLLKLRLNKYPSRPSTKEELERRINIQWYKITEKECQKYIDSMPARIKAVIKSKGGSTHY